MPGSNHDITQVAEGYVNVYSGIKTQEDFDKIPFRITTILTFKNQQFLARNI